MQQQFLEPRPLFGIGTVARLTGVKPDTLRVWERRYGLGASHKTTTARRQYTQSDLEHLQLVAALVASGVRIGEIATSERKTLEMLLRSHDRAELAMPQGKPRVIFIGDNLCEWLNEHQGCLANVDAQLARLPLAEAEPALFSEIGPVDMLVIECATVANAAVQKIQSLASVMAAGKVLVSYQNCSSRWQQELKDREFDGTVFPPEPAYLAYALTCSAAEKTSRLGDSNLGELMTAKPRQFSERQLTAARKLQSSVDCECPRHITDLVLALAKFEEYSANCSVENWHDAAVHSCIYAYTGQARWLMEKSLQAVLEQHSSPEREGDRLQQGGHLDNAA